MNQRNTLLIALLSLGCNMAAAGEMGPTCTSNTMTTPCDKSAWALEAQAVYLQASYPDAGTSFLTNQVFTPANTSYTFNYPNVGPKWNWGFFLQGAYSFKNAKDITVDWLRIHGTSSTTQTMVSYEATGTQNTNTSASFNFSPQLDTVNAVLGQTFDFDAASSARLYAGVEYARLVKNISNQYEDGSLYSNLLSSFNGFGPRIGVDLFFEPYNQPSRIPKSKLYAKGAATLLAGTSHSSSTANGNTLDTITTSFNFAGVVPAIDARLGIMSEPIHVANGHMLAFDLCWTWINYFNTLQQPNSTGGLILKGFDGAAKGAFALAPGGGVAYQGLQFGIRYTTA